MLIGPPPGRPAPYITRNSYISNLRCRPITTTRPANAPFRLPAAPVEADLLAKYFRVLGDRTRLHTLELVRERERSVGELVELLGEPQSKVSNHLACLRWCGFVTTRREHRTIHYRLADERVAAIIDLGRAVLHDNEQHIAACRHVDAGGR
jgi:DNA-binding transcriptional ArsR family regulator